MSQLTPIAKMVLEMIARGVDPEVIGLAVSTAETIAVPAPVTVTSADESVTRRRESDRLRQQKRRDNLRTSADSRDESRDVTSASLSKEEKIEEIKKEVGARQRPSRGQRLPDDWQPTAIDMAIAHELIGADRSRSELEKFRDHWKQQPGAKGVKLDWAAAWRNWTRRAAEYGGNRNGHGTLNGKNRSPSASFFAGIASVAADLNGHSPAPGDAVEEIPLGRFNIEG